MNKINIASLRKSLKLRQKDFGEKIGIKQAYLSEIESGKKPLTEELYNNIVNVFGIEKVSEYFVSNEASDNIAKANISEDAGRLLKYSANRFFMLSNCIHIVRVKYFIF